MADWWVCAVGAGAIYCIVEAGYVLVRFPAASSQAWGALLWFALAYCVVLAVLAPLVLIGAGLERLFEGSRALQPGSPITRWTEPGALIGVLSAGAVTLVPLSLVYSHLSAPGLNEHPEYTTNLKMFLSGALLVAGIGACVFWWVPACTRWAKAWPTFKSRSVDLPVAFLLALIIGGWVVHAVITPIYRPTESLLMSLTGVGIGLWGVRLTFSGAFTVRTRRALGVFGCLMVLLGPALFSRNAHASFVLYNHSPGVAGLAGTIRDALDFDGDGAASALVGGSDCDEFNGLVGPTEREVPGDGRDQDCRGGDAQKTKPVVPAAFEFEGCSLPEGKLNLILITVDALRADAVQPALMPRLSAVSAEMLRFRRAYSPATMTKLSLSSLFAGKVVTDISGRNAYSGSSVNLGRTLPGRLQQAGFQTTMFEFVPLREVFRAGFDSRNPGAENVDLYPTVAKATYSAAALTNLALQGLEQQSSKPFFYWLHYIDLHAPYVTPSGANYDAPPYERLTTYVDYHLGRLLSGVHQSGLHENTVIALTADHGEDLGMHGREGHGADLFESTIHVPLLLWVPGCAGRDIVEPVGLSQLAPTLGALLGVDMPGTTLASRDAPVVSEIIRSHGKVKRALVSGRYKLIKDLRSRGSMLFDLREDPLERNNIYGETDVTKQLEGKYQAWLDRPSLQ